MIYIDYMLIIKPQSNSDPVRSTLNAILAAADTRNRRPSRPRGRAVRSDASRHGAGRLGGVWPRVRRARRPAVAAAPLTRSMPDRKSVV